jgi:nickel/cobalt transporter (NicO) family protein
MCVLLLLLLLSTPAAQAQDPFRSSKTQEPEVQATVPRATFLVRISLWQQQLKQEMAGLIGQAKTDGSLLPLLTLLGIAFGYGAIHAAGPGHGKAVAMTFMLSRKASVRSGLLFGSLIALFHGLSGTLCVLALHGIFKTGVSASLGTVSQVTQVVSFSLILILGLGILVSNGLALLNTVRSGQDIPREEGAESTKALVPWAVSVGLIPCPGVIMVLLFCLSMDVLLLGLLLAVCISLGMAATISLVVLAASQGKGMALSFLSRQGLRHAERAMGALSGAVVATLGGIFLAATLL